MLPHIDIGYKNYIETDSVVAILNINSLPAKRLVDTCSKNKIFNVTKGNAGKCIIIMDNGDIYISARHPKTIKKNYYLDVEEMNKKIKTILLEPLVEVGFDNYIVPDKIQGMIDADTKPIQRMIKNKREAKRVFDCTHSKKTRSILVLKNGYIVLLTFNTTAIDKRRQLNIDAMIVAKNECE